MVLHASSGSIHHCGGIPICVHASPWAWVLLLFRIFLHCVPSPSLEAIPCFNAAGMLGGVILSWASCLHMVNTSGSIILCFPCCLLSICSGSQAVFSWFTGQVGNPDEEVSTPKRLSFQLLTRGDCRRFTNWLIRHYSIFHLAATCHLFLWFYFMTEAFRGKVLWLEELWAPEFVVQSFTPKNILPADIEIEEDTAGLLH